ncbi:MAG: hypothetical protein RR829_01285, partial [Oscillospiraceae bacterium]
YQLVVVFQIIEIYFSPCAFELTHILHSLPCYPDLQRGTAFFMSLVISDLKSAVSVCCLIVHVSKLDLIAICAENRHGKPLTRQGGIFPPCRV